jgi:hypothetical protein
VGNDNVTNNSSKAIANSTGQADTNNAIETDKKALTLLGQFLPLFTVKLCIKTIYLKIFRDCVVLGFLYPAALHTVTNISMHIFSISLIFLVSGILCILNLPREV